MKRRRFLAASALGVVATTAGCSTPGGRTELGVDEEVLDDDGMEKHLYFRDGDERVGVVSLDQLYEQSAPTAPFRFRIHVQHGTGEDGGRPESIIEGFRFDLRTPVTSVDPPAEIYLQAPSGGAWPDFTFEEVENFWARVEAEGTDEVGVGTVTLSLFVDPLSLPADELGVRTSIDLAEQGFGGTNYRLEANARFKPVVESD